MTVGLQISRLISVSVNLSPQAAQQASVTSCLIVGDSNVIDVRQRFRSYNTLAAVAADFGTTAPEYLAASLFFGQKPTPQQLYIGRWAQAATHGLLEGAPLTPAQQAIANWTPITNGGFTIAIDGGGPQSISALNFSAQTNLNGVATIINGSLSGGTVAWDGSKFIVTSSTTGASSSVVFATPPSGGTDISGQLGLTAAAPAVEVNGIAAESALTAMTILDTMPFNWYMTGFASTHIVDADRLAVAGYIEGAANPHIYGITTQNAAALDPTSSADIGAQIKALGYNRTGYQYSNTLYAMFSMFGRAATVDFTQANAAIDLMWKQEPGVVAENLTSTQSDSLDGKNYNYYAGFSNGIPILVNGIMASGLYFDEVQGADWMAGRVQTDLFNLLFQTPTKIPQTDSGVHQLVTTAEGSMAASVFNGLVGPGVWEFQGFGQLSEDQFLEKGYYVFGPPVSSESPSDRSARKATLQIAAILAGAINKVGVILNINR